MPKALFCQNCQQMTKKHWEKPKIHHLWTFNSPGPVWSSGHFSKRGRARLLFFKKNNLWGGWVPCAVGCQPTAGPPVMLSAVLYCEAAETPLALLQKLNRIPPSSHKSKCRDASCWQGACGLKCTKLIQDCSFQMLIPTIWNSDKSLAATHEGRIRSSLTSSSIDWW